MCIDIIFLDFRLIIPRSTEVSILLQIFTATPKSKMYFITGLGHQIRRKIYITFKEIEWGGFWCRTAKRFNLIYVVIECMEEKQKQKKKTYTHTHIYIWSIFSLKVTVLRIVVLGSLVKTRKRKFTSRYTIIMCIDRIIFLNTANRENNFIILFNYSFMACAYIIYV